MAKSKKTGEIYTPKWVTEKMLSMVGFNGNYLKKHVMDNSCGVGSMLLCVIKRPLADYWDGKISKAECIEYLEKYVHGIEINPDAYGRCIKNLDEFASKYHLSSIKWDVRNCDALSCNDYNYQMDYVIGNPPYIRVHDLDAEKIKSYSFTKGGMTDIYLAFYELGLRMLAPNGHLIYISPSSWYTSVAGEEMRKHALLFKDLVDVYDFEHEQLFDGVTTYVSISHFMADGKEHPIKFQSPSFSGEGWADEFTIDKKFYFTDPASFDTLKKSIEWGKSHKEKRYVVKNGYATLADSVFITGETMKNDEGPAWEKETPHTYLKKIVKASTGKFSNMIYPYEENGKLADEEQLKTLSPIEYQWLEAHKEQLLSRSTDYPWYAFGRTQAINDTYSCKFAVSSLISKNVGIKCTIANPGVGVYGGLYILPVYQNNVFVYIVDEMFIRRALYSKDFFDYVKSLRKYKSGGYYTFSSKDLENYINYKTSTYGS